MAEKPPGKAAAGKIACPTLKGILVVLPAARPLEKMRAR
jgi:hypothetical protein